MRNTLIVQLLVVAVVAGIYFSFAGPSGMLAALYGGATALASSLLLTWRLHQGKRQLHADPGRHLRSLLFSSLERLLAVVILLGTGFAILELMPLPLLAGFIAGQVAMMLSGLIWRN